MTVEGVGVEGEESNLPAMVPLLPLRFRRGLDQVPLTWSRRLPGLHSCTISSKPFKLFIMATPLSRKRQTPRIQATDRPISPVPKLSAKLDLSKVTACGRGRHVPVILVSVIFLGRSQLVRDAGGVARTW